MKIGILGSGVVGQTIGAKLVERGEDVVLGTRSPTQLANKRGRAASLGEWLEKTHSKARVATLQEAARRGW
jgi:ketopantoate reductase